ncbi:hypothetical protein C8Q74DRAFT_1213967 [Fomes fomentarius]|nr:hypothetical protein C8Q74DRAFT_1213967 [Fomes fomentarius]
MWSTLRLGVEVIIRPFPPSRTAPTCASENLKKRVTKIIKLCSGATMLPALCAGLTITTFKWNGILFLAPDSVRPQTSARACLECGRTHGRWRSQEAVQYKPPAAISGTPRRRALEAIRQFPTRYGSLNESLGTKDARRDRRKDIRAVAQMKAQTVHRLRQVHVHRESYRPATSNVTYHAARLSYHAPLLLGSASPNIISTHPGSYHTTLYPGPFDVATARDLRALERYADDVLGRANRDAASGRSLCAVPAGGGHSELGLHHASMHHARVSTAPSHRTTTHFAMRNGSWATVAQGPA